MPSKGHASLRRAPLPGPFVRVAAPLLAIALLFLSCGSRSDTGAAPRSRNDSDAAAAVEDPGTSPEVDIHPLSIEGLRDRSYEASDIQTVRFAGDRGSYKSYVVSYLSDGLKQFALMNVPNTPKPSSGYPVIIVCHGYIPPDEYTTTGSYKNTSAAYAAEGFLVLKPDYRGHGDSEGSESGAFRTIYYTIDVLHLLASLGSLDSVDASRIFLYGHSMGGEVGLRVLETTDAVRGAALWAPAAARFPENTLYFIRKRSPEQAADIRRELDAQFSDSDYAGFAPLGNTHLISVPLVLHHGTEDGSVPYDWSIALSEELRANRIHLHFYTYPGDDHNLARGGFFTAIGRDAAFFRDLF
jgi:dipeptidyl aminopeptidase/acylaminoacyl peptidase